MKDIIMLLSSVLFGILFSFLVFIFSIFIISRFFKRKYSNFEPKASIVVPAYNEERDIKQCIASIFNSTYPKNKLEIIVVDDGSTDNTLKIIKKYKNVRVLKQNHLGKVEALNLGALESSHEFILTIDADTILDKECIMELLKPFSDKSIGATTGNNKIGNNKSLIS